MEVSGAEARQGWGRRGWGGAGAEALVMGKRRGAGWPGGDGRGVAGRRRGAGWSGGDEARSGREAAGRREVGRRQGGGVAGRR